MVVQVLYVGVAAKEPQKLIDDGTQMQLLGGQQRKAIIKIEAHLVAKDASRACAGTVALLNALRQDMS